MFDEPRLSEAEWDLIVELLERERSDLPVEIHHTRSSSVRSKLHERAEMVQNLLARLRARDGLTPRPARANHLACGRLIQRSPPQNCRWSKDRPGAAEWEAGADRGVFPALGPALA